MLIMRATDEAYAAFKDVDFNAIIESMGRGLLLRTPRRHRRALR
jgi:hypothetical protein